MVKGEAEAGWLTRGQVARRLGVAVATVRRLEGKRLRVREDERGVKLFAEQDVDALARERSSVGFHVERRTEAEEAAEVCRLITAGTSFATIVIETKCPPERVRHYYEQLRAGFRQPRSVRKPRRVAPARMAAEARADERAMRRWEKNMRTLEVREDAWDERARRKARGG